MHKGAVETPRRLSAVLVQIFSLIDQLSGLYNIAGFDIYRLHPAVDGGGDTRFHLHGLDDGHHLAFLDMSPGLTAILETAPMMVAPISVLSSAEASWIFSLTTSV